MKALERGAWLSLQLFQVESSALSNREPRFFCSITVKEEREGVWKFEEERSYSWNRSCRMFAQHGEIVLLGHVVLFFIYFIFM